MRFAITATDRYAGVFESFVAAGWQPLKLFTIPIHGPLDSHNAVAALAERHRAAIQMSRMEEIDLAELRERGCEALVVASYPGRIPEWQPFLKYAVNFHCSPLPEARGPYPPVRAILEQRDEWAVTCHRVTPKVDRGEILAADRFALHADECHESLDLKIQMASKRLASDVAGRFEALWDAAVPQGEGSRWPYWTNRDRLLDFAQPVADIMRRVRAFGAIECLAQIDRTVVNVGRAVGWPEAHSHAPGRIVHVHHRSLVLAASDGYIGILEWMPAPENVAEEILAAT